MKKEEGKMAKKWEYKFMSFSGGTEPWIDSYNVKYIEKVAEQQEQLNKLGEGGWELVHYHFSEASDKCFLILKRELKKLKKEVE